MQSLKCLQNPRETELYHFTEVLMLTDGRGFNVLTVEHKTIQRLKKELKEIHSDVSDIFIFNIFHTTLL